ncbi:MAG TPA: hypothetical protein VHX65_00760 [Pirellulales bacterium]|jgi:hypothetical protein|nr:hypothetical protein [Pirellulales bacterium]
MRGIVRRTFALVAIAIGIALPDSRLIGDEPPTRILPPDTVQWSAPMNHGGVRGSSPHVDTGRFQLAGADSSMEGTTVLLPVETLRTYYGRYLAATDCSVTYANLWFSYKFHIGQAAPMLDAMYRSSGNPGNGIHFKRLTDDVSVKNLPDDRNLVIVPVGTSLRFVFFGRGGQLDERSSIEVVQLTGDDTAGSPRRARITVRTATTPREFATGGKPAKPEVAVGDTIPLAMSCQLAVKKIVPPDEKRAILGWVEFDPTPRGQESAICKHFASPNSLERRRGDRSGLREADGR